MQLTIEQLADKVNEIIIEHFKNNPESIKDGRQSTVLSTRRIRDYITKGLLEKPTGSGREKWFEQGHVDALVSLRLLQLNGLSEQYILSSTKMESISYEEPVDCFYSDGDLVNESKIEGLAKEKTFNPLLQNEYSNEVSKRVVSEISKFEDTELQSNAMDFLKSLQSGNVGISSSYRTPAENNKIASASANTLQSQSKSSLLNSVKSVFAKSADLGLLKSFAESQPKYRQFNEYCVDESLGVFLKLDSKLDTQLQKKVFEVVKQEINNHNIKENKK